MTYRGSGRSFDKSQALRLALLASICMTCGAGRSIGSPDTNESSQLPPRTEKTPAPEKATADEIDRYKKDLAQRVKADRRNAKRGDVLTPELTAFLLKRFREITAGTDGARTLALIKESNPGDLRLTVNGTYPEEAELATMPPAVLKGFPELPEGIEYRFVGCGLIVMARDSRVILDYSEECFW